MYLDKFIEIVDKQDQLNSRITSDWANQGYPWYRAIWIESAEILEHYGWKWWKKQEKHEAHIQMELIDILHFGISDMLQTRSKTEVAELVEQALLNPSGDFCEVVNAKVNFKVDFCTALEIFTTKVLTNKSFALAMFAQLCMFVNLDCARVYKYYMGKNVLNHFRQINGYKDGSYQKIWNGLEDNEQLINIVETMDIMQSSFSNSLLAKLDEKYKSCLRNST